MARLSPLALLTRLDPDFAGPSWAPWRSVTAALLGLEPEDPALVERLTGGRRLPLAPVREAVLIAGRGSGKSQQSARLAVYYATRKYRRAAGERLYVVVVAPTRQQAGITKGYIAGLLHASPALEGMIQRETQAEIELSNGVSVQVVTPDHRHVRGRSIACAIVEEACFLPTDDSATPDTELLGALRPALARVPGSLLLIISSPYAQSGEVYKAWRESYGKDDAPVLVVVGDTLTLNSTFDESAIARAYADDPTSAATEYGAAFRSDRERLFTREAVDACVVPGRFELPASLS